MTRMDQAIVNFSGSSHFIHTDNITVKVYFSNQHTHIHACTLRIDGETVIRVIGIGNTLFKGQRHTVAEDQMHSA